VWHATCGDRATGHDLYEPSANHKEQQGSLAIQKQSRNHCSTLIALSPLVHGIDWLSYQERLTYLRNAQSSFAGAETRGEVDLLSRSQAEVSPAIVARGTLAMFPLGRYTGLGALEDPCPQEDTTTLPSASETMHSAISRSDLHPVHPGAHYALLEQNEAVDSAITAFAFSILK